MPLSRLRRPAFLWLVSCLSLLALLHSWDFFRAAAPNDLSHLAPRGSVLIEGRVADIPRASRSGVDIVLQAVAADGASVSGRVLVHAPVSSAPAAWGDTVSVRGALKVPFPPETPGDGGYRGYLEGRGILSELDVSDAGSLRVGPSPGFSVLGAAAFLRARMLAAFALAPEPGASLLGAVLLGEKSLLPEGLVRAFRDAGALHLLVAAGLHVGFVLLFAAALARWLGASRVQSLLAGAVVGGVYVVCAGADAPLLRGYLMTLFGLAGFLLGRNSGAFQGLVLACWALAVTQPLSVLQPGFQMSFAAAFALVAAMPSWRAPAAWPRAARYLLELLLVSLAAQAALWPLSAFYFHQVSAAAPLANVLLAPMAAVLMVGGFGLFLLQSFGLHAVAVVIAPLITSWAQAILKVVDFFSDLPWRWSVPAPSAGFLLVYAAAFLAACALPDARETLRRGRYAALALLIAVGAEALAAPRLRLTFCSDRGAATTAFLRTPSGARVLLNAGASADALAATVLDSGSSTLDVLALDCLRPACWSGLEELTSTVRVREVWSPPGPLQGDLPRLKARLAQQGTLWREVWPSDSLEAGGVRFSLQGGYTGGPQDDFPWTLRWREFEARVDARRGLGVVKSLCSIIKRPSSFLDVDETGGLPERSLAERPPLEVVSDGRDTRIASP